MPQSLQDTLAAEIRAELGRQRRSQRELADLLGISAAGISDRLKGDTSFRIDELEKIAQFLGVNPCSLLNAPERVS